MTVETDVLAAAKHWGLDPLLVQAVVNAEGDIVKAVQCSIPSITTREGAIEVLCRSCTHALVDYVKAGTPVPFVRFWAARWAPQGVANDPTGLNSNWPHNVLQLWLGKPTPLTPPQA